MTVSLMVPRYKVAIFLLFIFRKNIAREQTVVSAPCCPAPPPSFLPTPCIPLMSLVNGPSPSEAPDQATIDLTVIGVGMRQLASSW